MRTVVTGAIGVSLYALQGRIWPQAFRVYMHSLKVMSNSKRDFGCAPVGNLARILQNFGVPVERPCIVFYGVYVIVLFLFLLGLSRLYREQRICFKSWVPVMLIGVVLLNPRVQSYDIAAVSLPMALVVWRSLTDADGKIRLPLGIGAAIVLLGLNVFLEINEDFIPMLPGAWKYLEMFMILGVFACGVRGLLKEAGIEWSAPELYPSWPYAPKHVPEFDAAGSEVASY
jgi:hypothetical protein